MNVLKTIVASKHREIAERRELYPIKLLEKSIYFESDTVSMCHYLLRSDKQGIIAEIKRKSPSRGDINPYIDVEQLSIGYMQAGASALSVLTDTQYFGGKSEDLTTARKFNYCPILRKDFIIDEYQVIEGKSIGADVVLLIAACLTPEKTKALAAAARQLGLEVLLEVHHLAEVESHLNDHVNILGVNNRNLEDFTVSTETSLELADHIPDEVVRISESGISSVEAIQRLKAVGYHGFLIGEYFMSQPQPHLACETFIKQLSGAHR